MVELAASAAVVTAHDLEQRDLPGERLGRPWSQLRAAGGQAFTAAVGWVGIDV